MNWGGFITLLGYNDRWRKYRRLIHPWLQKTATEVFHPAQEHHARILLQRLSQLPADSDSEELSSEFYGSVSNLIQLYLIGFMNLF
jgi:cytochrome P450